MHAAGFKLIFYPKYHCELNFIEMVWGFVKALHRRRCTYNYAHLKEGLPNTLESIPLRSIRKFHWKTLRYISAYRLDFTGPLLEYAVKKFTSHRAVPSGQKDAISREFEIAESKRRSKNIWLEVHKYAWLGFFSTTFGDTGCGYTIFFWIVTNLLLF